MCDCQCAWRSREYNGELQQRLSVASLKGCIDRNVTLIYPDRRGVNVGLPGRGREYNGELRQRLSMASAWHAVGNPNP